MCSSARPVEACASVVDLSKPLRHAAGFNWKPRHSQPRKRTHLWAPRGNLATPWVSCISAAWKQTTRPAPAQSGEPAWLQFYVQQHVRQWIWNHCVKSHVKLLCLLRREFPFWQVNSQTILWHVFVGQVWRNEVTQATNSDTSKWGNCHVEICDIWRWAIENTSVPHSAVGPEVDSFPDSLCLMWHEGRTILLYSLSLQIYVYIMPSLALTYFL